MQTKSVVDKTCGHGALPVGGFMATPIGAHVLSFCQKYPSAGRTQKNRWNQVSTPLKLASCKKIEQNLHLKIWQNSGLKNIVLKYKK